MFGRVKTCIATGKLAMTIRSKMNSSELRYSDIGMDGWVKRTMEYATSTQHVEIQAANEEQLNELSSKYG